MMTTWNTFLPPRFAAFAAALLAVGAVSAAADDFEVKRMEMLNRKREVIYNTDGCDAVYYPRDLAATKENFINRRLAFTRGSKIDSVFYCPVSSGFCHLTNRTDAGDRLVVDPPHDPKVRNVSREFHEMGIDPMKIAEEYCKAEKLEFFASIRVNDTHDVAATREKPYFLMPKFKLDHPELLFGRFGEATPYCSWSAVDFAQDQVRDRMAAVVAEICEKYDIDGIEYDFHRHMQLLRSVSRGNYASDAELDMMTNFMKRLRTITEAAGRKRGRPILVAIRTPDSVEYCRGVGIDLERWMKKKLFDIHIGGAYFRLNPWRTSAELAHRYGLKFYASLDESRVFSNLPLGGRLDARTYFAREHAAIESGCDGVYMFNMEGNALRHRVRGNDADLRGLDKIYYATTRGDGGRQGYPAGYFLRCGENFYNIPTFQPNSPHRIAPGASYAFTLTVGDDAAAADAAGKLAGIVAMIRTDAPDGALTLRINGDAYRATSRSGDVLTFKIAPKSLKKGDNRIEIAIAADAAGKIPDRRMILRGDRILAGANQPPWRRFFDITDMKKSEQIVDGAYRLNDCDARSGFATSFFYPLCGGFSGGAPGVGFDMMLETSGDPDAVVARIADGKNVELISFEPEKITFRFAGRSVMFNTTGRFHRYEARIDNGVISLAADGEKVLEAPFAAQVSDPATQIQGYVLNIAGLNTSGFVMGSITGPGTGASRWKNVELLGRWVTLADFALGINYRKPVAPELVAAAKAEISPAASIGVRDGKAVLAGFVGDYQTDLGRVDGNALKLIHNSGRGSAEYQCFQLPAKGFLAAPPRFLVAEWRLKVLAGDERKPGFGVSIAPARRGGGTWEQDVRFAVDGVIRNGVPIDCRTFQRGKFNTYRAVLDTTDGRFLLLVNGSVAINATTGNNGLRRKEPFLIVGDGSGNVAGAAELEYFKVGTPVR